MRGKKNSYIKGSKMKMISRKIISAFLAIAMVLGVFAPIIPVTQSVVKAGSIPTEEELSKEKASIRPRDKKINLDEIINWEPTDDVYDEIHKSVVPLENRHMGTVLNPLANPDAKVMSLAYLSSSSPLHSAVGGGGQGYKIYAFDHWQLLDNMVFWDGLIPNPEVTDAAHRNGVPMFGTIFFNWGSDGSMAEKVLQKKPDGTYPVAEKLVDIAKYYQFDGYFINQESYTSKSFREFLLHLKKYSKSINYPIEMIWYDGGGDIYKNSDLFESDGNGNFPSDMFFADFSWSNAQSPGSKMESNGLNKYDSYMGLELQKGGAYNTGQRKTRFVPDGGKTVASLGLFVPDTIIGMSKDGEDYHTQEQKFWVGNTNDPTTADDASSWSGIARFVADKTPITSLPFSTNFNTGHGRNWFIDGRKSLDSEWNGRSIQDVMPTWRWIVRNEEGNSLKARYDFDDAYNSGTSLKFEGALDAGASTTVQLYSLKAAATDTTKAKVAMRQTQEAKVELGIHTSEDYKEVSYFPVTVTDTWGESEVDLSSLSGKTIYAISIKVNGVTADEYSLNFGHLSIYDSSAKPQTPSQVYFDKVSYVSSLKAEAIIHVDSVKDAKIYEVYHKLNGQWEIINASSSNYIYLPDVKRDATSEGTTSEIKVVAVGENGVRSEALVEEFDWKMTVADTTEPKQQPINIMPLAEIVSAPRYNAEGPENILTGTINNTSDKYFYPGAPTIEVRLDKERTIASWGIDHAGAGGESVNDGLMNTKEFKIFYKDKNGDYQEVVHVTNNIKHVTEAVFETPITAQDWKLQIIQQDNGSPWGGTRIYNWRMYETLKSTINVPMSNAKAIEQADGRFTLTFSNGDPNAELTIYKENPAINKEAEPFITKQLSYTGVAIIPDVTLEGNSGMLYYTSKLKDLEVSNVLNLSYKRSSGEDEFKDPLENVEKPVKAVSIDAGRKYYSVDQIKAIIDKMSELGFTHLNLLLGNDGLRFLLDDMSLSYGDKSYTSEQIKAAITKGNLTYANKYGSHINMDKALTQSEMDEIFTYANSKKVTIIPAINSPGHMDAILYAAKDLGIQNPNYSYYGRVSPRTVDLENKEAVDFTKALLQKYISYFGGKDIPIFNLGIDEYANDATNARGWAILQGEGKYQLFADYVNELASMVKRAGMRPMAYNDGIYYNSDTDIKFDKDIIIALWTAGWNGFDVAPGSLFVEQGHDVLNVNDAWYYVLGREKASDGYYNRVDQALVNMKTTKFEKTVGGQIETFGSVISQWADDPSKEYDSAKLFDWMEVFAKENPTLFNVSEEPQEPESKPFINPIIDESMIIKYPEGYWAYTDAGNRLSHMIDGNDETFTWWASPNNSGRYKVGDYFGLDLGKEYELGRFRMVMGGLSKTDYFSKYVIKYSSDKENWNTYGDIINQTEPKKITDFIFEGVKARYVIVEALDAKNTWVQISEFMVETKEIVEEPEVDKTKLEEKIIEAKDIDLTDKTEESANVLIDAIAKAELLLESEEAKQEDVDQAIKDIDAAIEGLKDKPEDPVEPEEPEEPEEPVYNEVEGYTIGRINIRKSPSVSSEIVGEFLTGEKIYGKLYESNFGWIEIEFNGEKAYVHSSVLAKDPIKVEGYVIDALNIRESATEKSERIGSLNKGQYVEAVYDGSSDIWVKLTFEGKEGYIWIGGLQSEPVTFRGYAIDQVNVRKEATQYSDKITGLYKGAYVEGVFDGTSNVWAKIKYDGLEGYVYTGAFLEHPVLSKLYTEGKVNLRSDTSTKSEILAKIPKGKEIQGFVLSSNPDWVQVEYKGHIGYIHMSVLSYTR